MNIHWFSPLDAQSSEIARYSAQLLPSLQEYAGIVAVDDGQGGEMPGWLSGAVATPEPGVAPMPVYHIGNNPLHLPIFERSLAEPGLVVLHDLSLVDLARHLSHQLGQPQLWKEQMCRQYGEEVRSLVNRSEKSLADYNEMVAKYPLFLPFVEGAMGVICHSSYACRQLQGQLPPGTPLLQLNLPSRPPQPVPQRAGPDGSLRFVFCGHVGPNRRLIEFMDAWGQLPEPGRIALELFGNISNTSQLRQYAEHFGVLDYISFRGYVSDEQLDQALQTADFAINLRWPTMGEASASQLRYWAAALPTLVTDVGWYGELPDAAVCKISVATEGADLLALLQDALAFPAKYRQLGQRGWEQLRDAHSARHYAQELAALASRLSDARLAHSLLERELVPVIASMCENESDTRLFRNAIETVVATCTA
ncbi:MAG: glycosyltransferase [Halioglobus sp.]|nr:glycosyltransferase [Halioglobus sp.]